MQVVQEALVHANHILGCETVLRPLARGHRRGVQLKQVEGVGAEGGGFGVTQSLQGGRRQSGADYLQLQKVLSSLQMKTFIELVCLVFIGDVRFEDVGFGAVGDVSELS